MTKTIKDEKKKFENVEFIWKYKSKRVFKAQPNKVFKKGEENAKA